MKDKTNGGIRRRLLAMTIIPIMITGIVIMVFCYYRFLKTMDEEVQNGLHSVAMATKYACEDLYERELVVEKLDENSYKVELADGSLDDYYEYLDRLNADTDIDISLFYYDIRVLTTIRRDGERIEGTVSNRDISNSVIKEGHAGFYNNVVIGGQYFYAYYAPIENNDGEIVGMVFAGKPTVDIENRIKQSIAPIVGISAIMILLGALVSISTARNLSNVIEALKVFLGSIAQGELRATIDERITGRSDELGEMSRFTLKVQTFIIDMIERDPLTKLYTRRIGEIKMHTAQDESVEAGNPFCLVMADIDHFKRFNDTYGHDCGDLVLSGTAAVFNKTLRKDGFAVRWGGEEFIVFYQNKTKEEALEALNTLRDAVRSNELEYQGEKLKITMTFGLVEGDSRSLDAIVKDADELLYEGKTGGRDRIVVKE